MSKRSEDRCSSGARLFAPIPTRDEPWTHRPGSALPCYCPTTSTVTYLYSAAGTRVGKKVAGVTTEIDMYDLGGHLVSAFDGSGNLTREEIYAGNQHVATYTNGTSGTTYFNHSDWLGTERARSNMTASICETVLSQPFGDNQQTSGSCGDPSPNHFTGKQRDTESGNDYFGARYYGSTVGRFMTPDPVSGSAWNPQSLNLYSYGWNNPLKLTDPSGMVVSWEDSATKCDHDGRNCKTDLQRKYEKRIEDLLESKNKKERARGRALEATYQKLQDAKETFHVVREGGDGSGDLAYRGHPGDLHVEMKGSGSFYGEMPDLQKIGHEFKHGEQFLNGLIGFQQLDNGKWTGYRDDLVDEANAFIAGFMAEPVEGDQSEFLRGLGQAAIWGVNAVVSRLDAPGSPYRGRSTTQLDMTFVGGKVPPNVYAIPRTQ